MKTIKLYLTLVIMAMVCITTFSACGSDDDDDTPVNGSQQQRIEMIITGDTKGWVIMENSYGYTVDPNTADQTCSIKCSHSGEGVFADNNMIYLIIGADIKPNYPVTVTLDGNAKLIAGVSITKNGEYAVGSVSNVTITLKGYKGSTLTNTFTKTYNASTSAVIKFHADKNDDKEGVDGEKNYNFYK